MNLDAITPIPLGNVPGVEPFGSRVNVFLLAEPFTLINTGHPSQVDDLKSQLKALGVEPGQIERIVCTSWSIDSVGGVRHFPRADVFLLSPDGLQPYEYRDVIDAEKNTLRPYLKFAGAPADDFFHRWFGQAPGRIDFIPLALGSAVVAGKHTFDVHPLHGFDPGACLLYAPETQALFGSELVLDGTPPNVRSPQAFLADLDRAASLGATHVYPTHGSGSSRASADLKRAARWANNLLSNAQHAMRGSASLAEFVERDLGYIPEDPVEFALRMRAIKPFLDELVDSRVVEAEGEGLERRYGTNVGARV